MTSRFRHGKRSAAAFMMLAGALIPYHSAFAEALDEDSPARISANRLVPQQDLPSLTGAVPEQFQDKSPQSLNISQAVQRAVQWHPDIAEQVGKLFEQDEQVNYARSKYYPQISGGINNSIANNYAGHGYSPGLVLSVSQMLYDFGKVDSSVRSASAGVAQQQATVLVTIDKIGHDTAAALVQVQGYQQLVNIAQQQLDSLNSIGGLAQQRNDEGASSLSDVVQTNTRIEGARATLMQYRANLDRWRATLASYLGWQAVNKINDDFPKKLQSACQVMQPDDRLIPSVLAAWAAANKAQAGVDYANAQRMPTISLVPQVTHYLNDKYPNSATIDRTQYSANLKVEMPLYQGGGLDATRNAAQHSLEAANAQVRSARLLARQQLSASQNEALSLSTTLAIQARQQALGQKTRELYQQQYLELGTRQLLDVLNAEQEIYQSRFTEQQTITQLRTLQLDCLYSTGHIRSAFALDNQTIQQVEIQP